MNKPIVMITVDGFAAALLSAIRQLMEAPSWTDYLMLIHGILHEEGNNQAEYANRLKSFLPRYPKIAQFHNALAELTNPQPFEETGREECVIPYVRVVDGDIPEWVKEEFEHLQARFVTILPHTEPVQQASDDIPITMDDISQGMQGIDINIHEYPIALSIDNAHQTLSNARVTAEVMEDMEMDAWDTDPTPSQMKS